MSETDEQTAEKMMQAEAARMMNAGEYVEIDGDDYCEGCAGWDGNSRRCDCGNRRVCWDWEKTPEGIVIFPQTY